MGDGSVGRGRRDEKKEGKKEMSAESPNFCIIFVHFPAIAHVKIYLRKCDGFSITVFICKLYLSNKQWQNGGGEESKEFYNSRHTHTRCAPFLGCSCLVLSREQNEWPSCEEAHFPASTAESRTSHLLRPEGTLWLANVSSPAICPLLLQWHVKTKAHKSEKARRRRRGRERKEKEMKMKEQRKKIKSWLCG